MNNIIKQDLEAFYEANVWGNMTFGQALTHWSQQYAKRTAICESDIEMTYEELEANAIKLAFGFQKLGLKKGDTIVLQIPNSIDFVVISFALFKLGVIPVMALPAQRKAEIKGIIEKSQAKGYIIKDNYIGFDYKNIELAYWEEREKLAAETLSKSPLEISKLIQGFVISS